MIECHDLFYTYKNSKFNLTISETVIKEQGVYALVGHNGVGKSTLLKLMSGILKPSMGGVFYENKNVFNEFEQVKTQIHYISSETNLYQELTIQEHSELVKNLYKDWNQEVFTELIEEFNLFLNIKIKTLSKGQLAKLKIALSLATEAKVILIDELTNDIDHTSRKYIFEQLNQYSFEKECLVIVATNILEDMEKYASHLIYLKNGHVKFNDELDKLKEEFNQSLTEYFKENR